MSAPPAAKSSASAAALGVNELAAEPVQARMSAPAAGDAGSADALGRLEAAVQDLKAKAVRPALQKAVAALRQDDFRTGGEQALKALEIDERNGFAWYLLAISRERAGDFAGSIRCYESALALIPDHADVANDLGRLAYRMGMKDTAEKLFAHFLRARPDSFEAANNLACVIRDQGRFNDAVEILRPAIMAFPANAMLWNTLGTVVGEQGDTETSRTFFDEALSHDPAFAKARYNRGNARLMLGDVEGALDDCETAMAQTVAVDEKLMMQLARSTIRMASGQVGEGWDDYEVRLDPRFADVTRFMCDRPRWAPGADLAGKTLLVFGEQGLGDEAMFANLLPDVIEALGPDGQLILAVEARLVPLFQRSFPAARVGAHGTWKVNGHRVRGAPFMDDMSQVDVWTPIASLLRQFRRSVEAFPATPGFLRPDAGRIAHWRATLDAAAPGPKVGLLWKSLLQNGARHRFFSPFEQWAPVLATPGVTFVNLQYGDCAAELEQARRELGLTIVQPPGIDLKDELDEVAALACALDLIVGPANATSSIAAACGAPVWFLSTPSAWPRLGTDRLPWYPQARAFSPPGFGQWEQPIGEMAAALARAFPVAG